MDLRLRQIVLLLVDKYFPRSNVGRKRAEASYILDELLYILWTGCPWRGLRSTECSFQTVHRHFQEWSNSNKGTSKNCPCGNSQLEDVPNSQSAEGNRLRRHKTFGQDGICCVECSLGEENMDRDVLAVINFLLCARAALEGKERPKHLCRAC